MAESVYQYIAQFDPNFSKSICHKYGYKISNVHNGDSKALGQVLAQLVVKEGEPAFRDLMTHHPDKDVILELFSVDAGTMQLSKASQSPYANSFGNTGHEYANFSGREDRIQLNSIGSQTGTFIIAAALLLSVAIIAKH
jgi:hypothetical protein